MAEFIVQLGKDLAHEGMEALKARVSHAYHRSPRQAETMRFRYRLLLAGALLLALSAPGATAQEQELPLGAPLPMQDATVQLVNGTTATLGSLTGANGTVLVFWSNQCAWIDKYKDRVLALYNAYAGDGIAFVLVNANDATAFPKEAASVGQAMNLPMSYVMDAGSRLALTLGASRTPHVYAFDADRALFFVGAIDDSPGDPANVQKTYLKDALEALKQGKAVEKPKTTAFGCTIKFQGG